MAPENIQNFEVFHNIMKQEENKGRLKTNYYPDEIQKISKDLLKLRAEYRKCRDDYEKKQMKCDVDRMKEELDEKKDIYLKEIVSKINNADVEIKIKESKASGKVVYVVDNMETMLICKFLMRELRKSYRQYPANRNEIVEELKVLLDDKMQKVLIRTDIHHFFESIPQENLIKKISEDAYVSPESTKNIKKFFYQYNSLKSEYNEVGLPRGICFSSYLAEIYLKQVDREIAKIDGIYFYKRYVDDIVILATPKCNLSGEDYYMDKIKKILEVVDLKLNTSDKYSKIVLDKNLVDYSHFTYLGYEFIISKDHVDLALPDKKKMRYKILIDMILETYSKCSHYNKYKKTGNERDKKEDALMQMINEFSVLTGNGLLSGHKNYVAVGIFYSNKLLTCYDQLKELDEYLYHSIDNKEKFDPPRTLFRYNKQDCYDYCIDKIKNKIKMEYSFEKGFTSRRMYKGHDYQKVITKLKRFYLAREDE